MWLLFHGGVMELEDLESCSYGEFQYQFFFLFLIYIYMCVPIY